MRIAETGWAMATPREGALPPFLELQMSLSPGRGVLAWLEPARNDFRLVGAGRIRVGDGVVRITGRRLVPLLGLPFPAEETLDRERVVNVEVAGSVMRFELQRIAGRRLAMTCQLESASAAEQLAQRLPLERTADFHPELAAQKTFEEQIRVQAATAAPVTTVLLALNVFAFAVTVLSGAEWLRPVGNVQITLGSNFGPYTTDGEWWRLLTSLFLHFGLLHLAFNMWALAATGPLVERLYGSGSFSIIYLVAGLAASLTSVAWRPYLNSAGASGAIFGVYGALLAALLRNRGAIPLGVVRPIRYSTVIFILSALVAGAVVPGVDNAAHLGGVAVGFVVGALLARPVAAGQATENVVSPIAIAVSVSACIVVAGIVIALQRTQVLTEDALFWRTQHWLVREEARAVARQTELWQLARNGKIDDARFATAIESEVLPVWQDAERRLGAILLPETSALAPRLSFLRKLAEARRGAYQLCVEGARKSDEKVMRQCVQELARGDRLVGELGSGSRASK